MKIKGKVKSAIRIIICCILLYIIALFIPHFLTFDNILNVIRQSSIIAIPAIGLTMVMITKGIDLSTAGLISFIPMLFVFMVGSGINWVAALLISLVTGTAIGIFDGVVIAKIGVPPFISTLVFGSICSGFALVIGSGRSTSVIKLKNFIYIGNGDLFGFLPVSNIILLVFAIIGILLLSKTPFGNRIYGIGNNEIVVMQEGINVDNIKIAVYGISGFCSAVAGIMLTSKLATAHPTQGAPFQLDCIAACIVGGVSMLGGEGKVLNTVIGALLIGILRNALNMFGVHPFIQNLLLGGLIILIVSSTIYIKQRKQKALRAY